MKETLPRYSYEVEFDDQSYPFTCGGYYDIDQVLTVVKGILLNSGKKIKQTNIVFTDFDGESIKTPFDEAVRIRETVSSQVKQYKF
jgi:hypothetical protein